MANTKRTAPQPQTEMTSSPLSPTEMDITLPPSSPSSPLPSAMTKVTEEELVLSYLRRHGMGGAAEELGGLLRKRKEQADDTNAEGNNDDNTNNTDNKDNANNDGDNNNDRDGNVEQPPKKPRPSISYSILSESAYLHSKHDVRASTGSGYDVDGAPSMALWGAGCPKLVEKGVRDEARGYVEGFTGLVTWILSLGDDPAFVSASESGGNVNAVAAGDNINDADDNEDEDENAMEVDEQHDNTDNANDVSPTAQHETHENQAIATLVQNALKQSTTPSNTSSTTQTTTPTTTLLTPPTTIPELLSLSFPLMVHTYCELLSSSLPTTASAFLSTYRHLYEPSHPDAIADLEKCCSTEMLVELNEAVMNSNAVQSEIRGIKAQIGVGMKKRGELQSSLEVYLEREKMKQQGANTATKKSSIIQDQENNLSKVDTTLAKLNQRLSECTTKNNEIQTKLSAFPFLRRVRALKWNVTISTSTYRVLEMYASSQQGTVMMALLMNRCHLIVEEREALPYCPQFVLDDFKDGQTSVKWAVPMMPGLRAMEAGEEVRGVDGKGLHKSILVKSEMLPYPKYALEEGEGNDAQAKAEVEFNRALLVNGFRRLEALEKKRNYESYGASESSKDRGMNVANPLSPSVLLGSLCCSSEADAGAGAPWAESHVGIVSASICPPDGRKVAVGCDDAAVRIWSLDRPVKKDSSDNSSGSALGEPSMVLLGHKNGFPVFDVDWTRNGRTLLSAGGDGSIRLWDTEAVGPYGKLSNVSMQKGDAGNKNSGPSSSTVSGKLDIPGSKAESLVEISGAALSVYRGHAPSTPVWSVSSAPSGYYFASAGSDYTARIWCTDRCSPMRVLSGHISPSVNCVTWHPNCNYVLTASDDKTCRMWDIQTGKCVRILAGSSRGLNLVRVSPSGRYAAGAGYDNIVRIWELGSGRLVNELRPTDSEDLSFSNGTINSMSYSACGSALAVAGEDCTVKIWDVRGVASHMSNPEYFAAAKGPNAASSMTSALGNASTATDLGHGAVNAKVQQGMRSPGGVFKTNNISVLDLKYTKRNLLLAVGNYAV